MIVNSGAIKGGVLSEAFGIDRVGDGFLSTSIVLLFSLNFFKLTVQEGTSGTLCGTLSFRRLLTLTPEVVLSINADLGHLLEVLLKRFLGAAVNSVLRIRMRLVSSLRFFCFVFLELFWLSLLLLFR